MKRSDAIEALAKYLSVTEDTHPDPREHRTFTQKAESVLSYLEELGIFPPETDISRCSNPELLITRDYFSEYVPDGVVLGWDEE